MANNILTTQPYLANITLRRATSFWKASAVARTVALSHMGFCNTNLLDTADWLGLF